MGKNIWLIHSNSSACEVGLGFDATARKTTVDGNGDASLHIQAALGYLEDGESISEVYLASFLQELTCFGPPTDTFNASKITCS